MLRLWTDGCCLHKSRIGGWAVVAERRGEVVAEWSGHVGGQATSNRMELLAVIEAIKRAEGKTEIVSDSTYAVKGATLWLPRWKELDWRRGSRHVKNADLWKEIDALFTAYSHPLRVRWVKGHMGGVFNELADRLAGEAARA